MKYLIITLTIMLGLLLPNLSYSQSGEVIPWPSPENLTPPEEPPQNNNMFPIWAPGDKVETRVLCKDKETIRKIVWADKRDKANLMDLLNKFVQSGICMGLHRPVQFTVEDLHYQYKDSDGVDTVVMKVFKQVEDKVINGYLIVYGTISPSI
jgi:hypothetical protein